MEAHLGKGFVVSQGSDDVFEQAPVLTEQCGDSAVPYVSMSSTSLTRSEKGQQARDAYRSSGYGTESGDNANGSVASQSSDKHSQLSLSGEACAAGLPSNLIPELSTGAQQCFENDFRPISRVLYINSLNVNSGSVFQNPTEQEFEKPLPVNQDTHSEQIALSLPTQAVDRITALGQQSISVDRITALGQQSISVDRITALGQQSITVDRITALGQQSMFANKSDVPSEVVAVDTPEITAGGGHQDLTASSSHVTEMSKLTCQNLPGYQRQFTSYKMAETHQTNCNIFSHVNPQRNKQQHQQQQLVNIAPLADTTLGHTRPHHLVPDNYSQESGQSGIEASAKTPAVKLETRIKPPFHRQDGLLQRRTTTEDDHHLSASFDDANKDQTDPQTSRYTQSSLDVRSIPCEPDTSSSFYLSEHPSSFGCQFDIDMLKVLTKCARCQEASCDNIDCMQMRKEFAVLMDREGIRSLNERQLMLLQTALYHGLDCSHPRCPLPWCADNLDKCLTSEDGIKFMKNRIENYAGYCKLMNSPVEEFMKLNKTFPLDTLPLEGKHWERMCMLKNSRKTILALPSGSDLSEYKYWVIKKILTTEDSHYWDLHRRLRDLNHKSIATFLWAARFEHHLIICHMFENLSLCDCLHDASLHQLGLTTVCHILHQMMSAVDHLHNLRIVYLYWMSKNVLVSCQAGESFCVKLSNFSCSVFLDNYDGRRLYLSLPPAVMPPELRAEDTVELVSDVWGLGCLLNELVTGKPVWHEHRHLPDDDLHVLIGENPIPEIPRNYPELLSLFQNCWETDWSKRKTVRDLELLLAEIYV